MGPVLEVGIRSPACGQVRGSAPGGAIQGGGYGPLPVLQSRLVAAVGDVILGARQEAPLDRLARGEILLLHGSQREIEIASPMLSGARTGCWLGNAEIEKRHALVDLAIDGEYAPHFGVIALHDDNRVRKQDVHDRRVSHEIPLAVRQLTHVADTVSGERLAHVEAEWVKQTDIVQKNRRHGIRMQNGKVVGLQERVDEHLPIHSPA